MNDELGARFEQRATRGAERGADAVYDAAMTPDYASPQMPGGRRRPFALVAAAVLALGAVAAGTFVALGTTPDAGTGDSGPLLECRVFLQPQAAESRRLEIYAMVEVDPMVASASMLTQDDAYAEFRELHADKPELLASITPEMLPPSVRAGLRPDDGRGPQSFRERYNDLPDVLQARCEPDLFGDAEPTSTAQPT